MRRFHHTGYVVADLAAGMEGFARSLAGSWDGRIFADPYQKVRVAFLETNAGDALIELVEPAAEDSPVLRFLKEQGGGLHHVCYEVENLEGEIGAMKERGAMVVRKPKPAVAFDGRLIAWLVTRERLLVELLEQGAGGPSIGGASIE